MRDCYNSMLHDCPIPRLWGLSALDISMRVYCGDKAGLEVPPVVMCSDDSRALPSDCLTGEWGVNLLSQDGFQRMKEVVTDISLTGHGNM